LNPKTFVGKIAQHDCENLELSASEGSVEGDGMKNGKIKVKVVLEDTITSKTYKCNDSYNDNHKGLNRHQESSYQPEEQDEFDGLLDIYAKKRLKEMQYQYADLKKTVDYQVSRFSDGVKI
jgi:hypothetical protein